MFEIRIAICLITLVIASIMDLRKREISDGIWILAAIAGTILFMFEFNKIDLVAYIIKLGITAIISYAIYKTGFFGGADAKALLIIMILLPSYEIKNNIHGIVSLTVLTNGITLTIVNVLHNILRNFIEVLRGRDIFDGFNESLYRKMFAFILGFRAKNVNGYMFLMEERNGKEKRFRFNVRAYDEFATNTNDVWITPALPFIIYITLGFIITLVYGDIIGGMLANLTNKT